MNTTPIVSPIVSLLRSRKFITAAVSLGLALFFYAFPQFESFREPATFLIGALALAIIGGIAYEDAAKAAKEESQEPVKPLEDQIRDITTVVLDELLKNPGNGNPTV